MTKWKTVHLQKRYREGRPLPQETIFAWKREVNKKEKPKKKVT